MPEIALTPPEVARRSGLSVRSLERFRISGDGPPFVRLGKRRVGYLERELDAWLKDRTYAHRAAEMASVGIGGRP